MSKQLDQKSQGMLHAALVEKLDAAKKHLKQMKADGVKEDDKDFLYLNTRVSQIKICQRLTLNTAWIIEFREQYIKAAEDQLKSADLPATKRKWLEKDVATMKRAQNCKKCMNGRGFTGYAFKADGFVLCDCTMRTLNLHILN